MEILTSLALWIPLGIAGVMMPIVIHLLSRYRSRRIDWAAMELLRRAMVIRARRLRLEDLILLILRCLAVALLAVALAQLVLTAVGASWLGGGGKAAVVIAVDGSFSMSHRGAVHRRFDLARQRAEEVLATLSPGDPVTLIVMSDEPIIKLRNVAYDPEKVDAVLKGLAPTSGGLNLELCLDEIEKMVGEMKAPTRECYLITDGQGATWADASDAARKTLERLSDSCNVFLVPVGPERAENLAVTRLALASGTLRKGSLARYVVDVQNAGWAPHSDVIVQLTVDGTVVDMRTIDTIKARQTVSVPLFAQFDESGSHALSARLSKDRARQANDTLGIDDARYLVTEISETVNVLCVDGNPSDEAFRSETGYLAAALAPQAAAGSVVPGASGVNVSIVAAGNVENSRLFTYDIVILANVPEIPRDQAIALGAFVRRGGGLIVFPGNRTDPQLLNQIRDSQSGPLLPAELGEAIGTEPQQVGAARGGWAMEKKTTDHPVTRVLTALAQEQWSNIRFHRYFKLKPRDSGRVLLKLAPGGDPLLVEHAIGKGHVLLFASTANRRWTDMVVHPAYLMMVQQAVTYLTRKPSERPVQVSRPLVFELSPVGVPLTVGVHTPAGRDISVRVTDREGHKAVVLPAEHAGVYSVRWPENAPEMKAAVNVDAGESGIYVLRDDALEEAADKLSVAVIDVDDNVQAAVQESRIGQELWRTLLIVALIALVAEAVLSSLFVRRRGRSIPLPVRTVVGQV